MFDEIKEKTIPTVNIRDLGLLSISARPIYDSTSANTTLIELFAGYALKEKVSTSVQGLVIRTLEPYLDLKKGLGTKRHILPEKWDEPIPNVPENKPERFLGEDLNSNEWRQDYWEYDTIQEFKGELSVYTTNHFIDNKDRDPKKINTWKKQLKDAPQKCYMITGIQIMSESKPMVDFIKIQKKHIKTIDMISTETIWAQPNRFYELRTPIIFNPDMDIIFSFTPDKDWSDISSNGMSTNTDNIMIHGWVCEPLGKTVFG